MRTSGFFRSSRDVLEVFRTSLKNGKWCFQVSEIWWRKISTQTIPPKISFNNSACNIPYLKTSLIPPPPLAALFSLYLCQTSIASTFTNCLKIAKRDFFVTLAPHYSEKPPTHNATIHRSKSAILHFSKGPWKHEFFEVALWKCNYISSQKALGCGTDNRTVERKWKNLK